MKKLYLITDCPKSPSPYYFFVNVNIVDIFALEKVYTTKRRILKLYKFSTLTLKMGCIEGKSRTLNRSPY